MNNSVFEHGYAEQYDLLYGDKDYEAECDLIEKAFQLYKNEKVQSILDLGCGTGNHAFPLAQRGYHVTGIDFSAGMLSQAREKAKKLAGQEASDLPEFLQGDVRNFDLNKQYDAVLLMFAVLGYQLTNEDVLSTLRNVRKHLKPGGIFVFDVWYGPAVLAIRPSDRIKIIPTTDGKLIRAASGDLDIPHHLSTVSYHLWQLSGDRVIKETEEKHTMRYFFPMELALLLSICDLSLESITAFPFLDKPSDETTWNILIAAKCAY
jgi:SAM-dependent methyltransferase